MLLNKEILSCYWN